MTFFFPMPPPLPPPRIDLIGKIRSVIKVVEFRDENGKCYFERLPDYPIEVIGALADGRVLGWPYYDQRWRGRRLDTDELVDVDGFALDELAPLEALAGACD